MRKMTVGETNEKEARYVEETHDKTFRVCAHACYYGQDDMKMTRNLANSTKNFISEGVLYLPCLPLR